MDFIIIIVLIVLLFKKGSQYKELFQENIMLKEKIKLVEDIFYETRY